MLNFNLFNMFINCIWPIRLQELPLFIQFEKLTIGFESLRTNEGMIDH